MNVPSTIRWERERLAVLDQRLLPSTVEYLEINSVDQAVAAIRSLAVRGAPAIGIAAAYALAVSVRAAPPAEFESTLHASAAALKGARPTAVNLAWAVDRLLAKAVAVPGYRALAVEAELIHQEDRASCRAIGEAGLPLISPGSRILTHCNAGALAVSELGTATAPLYLSHSSGTPFHVYVDETRPLLQGARMTAWELSRAGIDVTLLCDSAAASLMGTGGIDLVLVGTDRVTANGDVVNKIGTLNLAVLCSYFGIPFYVACPSSTFDPATSRGADVIIENRDSAEIIGSHTAQVAAYNPAFDVTPAHLVTGFITDRGLLESPAETALNDHFIEAGTP